MLSKSNSNANISIDIWSLILKGKRQMNYVPLKKQK